MQTGVGPVPNGALALGFNINTANDMEGDGRSEIEKGQGIGMPM